MRRLAFTLLLLFATPLVAQDVYNVVDEPPQLVGGLDGLAEQIQYPQRAKLAGLEGRVIVQFVVDEQGDVRDAKVVRGIEGGGFNEEALRVVRQAQFTPGRHQGQPAKVRFALPIHFVLPRKTEADQ